MKVIHQIILVTLTVILFSCGQKEESAEIKSETNIPVLISATGVNASGPYLTSDHKGNPVLCWTEDPGEQTEVISRFAVFNKDANTFDAPVTINPSKGTRAHPESMNKVAFKSDGSIVAVYARKKPTEENPYAGFIMYAQSFDGGKQWTPERYLHSDTLEGYGRSYFDLATLADGEVGAIWLDGRLGDADKGSALFFTKTEGNGRFGIDKQIGESTCECCRTDLYVEQSGTMHIAYRDILNDSIRDIVHQVSVDNGETFSTGRRISRDNWNLVGCPHTGPSMVKNSAGLNVVWFTAGGGSGVYHTRSADNGKSFSLREKLSIDARHPQVTALSDKRLAIVWDEHKQKETLHAEMQADSGKKLHVDGVGSGVKLQIRDKGAVVKSIAVTDSGINASYPVLTPIDEDKILIAWTQEVGEASNVYYSVIDL